MATPVLAPAETWDTVACPAVANALVPGQETAKTTLSEKLVVSDGYGCMETESKKQSADALNVEPIESVTPEHAGLQKQKESMVDEAQDAEAVESITPKAKADDGMNVVSTGGTPKAKADDGMNVVSTSDKEESSESSADSCKTCESPHASTGTSSKSNGTVVDRSPTSLPRFREPKTCMWTASYAANAPSEDRSASLVNLLFRPLNESSCGDSQHSLIRMSLFAVMDGHGGGSVATYAAEVLLPHIAANVMRTLDCELVDRGECRVNGKLRDVGAIDFEGIIGSSIAGRSNANSIHYRTPAEEEVDDDDDDDNVDADALSEAIESAGSDEDCDRSIESEMSLTSPLLPRDDGWNSDESAEVSFKMGSDACRSGPTGTHGTDEVARVTQAIAESFCAVDEGWINSIDVNTTYQTACQPNGSWNAGACALVLFTVQRLEWTTSAASLQDPGPPGNNGNAAHRCVTDFVNIGKSDNAVSAVSSKPALAEALDHTESALDTESTETQDEENRRESQPVHRQPHNIKLPKTELLPQDELVLCTAGNDGCHAYRPQDAMLYAAHVGDCRAVLLGSTPPRTMVVSPDFSAPPNEKPDTSDDSSCHSSRETELLSSSDCDTGSSDDESSFEDNSYLSTIAPPHMKYMTRPARRIRRTREYYHHEPLVALPSINKEDTSSTDESESESSDDGQPPRKVSRKDTEVIADDTQVNGQSPFRLSSAARPMDLTTDHSAYNPSEIAAVLRRCNYAPRAISSCSGGGISRVAGSLAVTRALGDAYLKTPRLSFSPYKRNAPYITARPEVSCRLLARAGNSETNNVVVLATDGVWERANGQDVLRWMKCYSEERVAFAERRSNRSDEMKASQETERNATFRGRVADRKRKKIPSRRRTGSAKRGSLSTSTAADVIVKRVLDRVRRTKKMSLQELVALPPGRARRSTHDDITAMVVDLRGFIA